MVVWYALAIGDTTMDIVTKADALEKRINKLLEAGKAFKDELHLLLVSSAIHCARHEDDTFLNTLVKGTAKLCHKNTVARWIAENAPVIWDKENERFKCSDKKIKAAQEDMDAFINARVESKPYHEIAKVETPFAGLNVIKDLERYLAKLISAEKGEYWSGENKGEEITEEDKEKLDLRGAVRFKALMRELKRDTADASLN